MEGPGLLLSPGAQGEASEMTELCGSRLSGRAPAHRCPQGVEGKGEEEQTDGEWGCGRHTPAEVCVDRGLQKAEVGPATPPSQAVPGHRGGCPRPECGCRPRWA